MGGRIYDPLAARFTTADPIMQAPFWSQGQNRYAYVFNDPINATDPSGFSVDGRDVSDGVSSGAAMGWLPGGMGLAMLLRNAGSAGAGSALGGAVGLGGGLGNVLTTFSLTPGALTPGSSWQTASPATAPISSLNKANAMASAPAQAAPPGALQETHSGPPAPCNTAGHPKCRTAAVRARTQSALSRQIDQLVQDWANSPSMLDPTHQETIRGGTTSSIARHRVEQTAGIVVSKKGVPRLTRTFSQGNVSRSEVEWDRVRLHDGDRLVGTVHSHPGGPGLSISPKAISIFAHGFKKQLMDQAAPLVPGIGVQIYVVQPADVGGILNYDEARNFVSPLPK